MNTDALSQKLNGALFESAAEDKGDSKVSGTVAVFRVNNGNVEVLVGMRLWDPDKGKLALPGGHLKKGEAPQIGALRELEEETGVKVSGAVQVLDRPPEIGRETRDVSFAVLLEKDQPLRATSDLANVHWISTKRLPPMAFKDEVIVREALPKVLDRFDLRLIEALAENIEPEKLAIIQRKYPNHDIINPRYENGQLVFRLQEKKPVERKHRFRFGKAPPSRKWDARIGNFVPELLAQEPDLQ